MITMPENELGKKLEQLDLECIKFKLVTCCDWPLEKADYVADMYKCYLYVCATRPDIIVVPSKQIDEFWHMHILDTRKYHEDCGNILGEYLHHYPYIGILSDEDPVLIDNHAKTSDVFMELFGVDLTLKWEDTSQKRKERVKTCKM